MPEYIEREAALKAVSENDCEGYSTWAVKAIPAADVVPVRHGRWKPFDTTYGRSIYYCTACEHSTVVPTVLDKPIFDYCPNCGAKMDGEA